MRRSARPTTLAALLWGACLFLLLPCAEAINPYVVAYVELVLSGADPDVIGKLNVSKEVLVSELNAIAATDANLAMLADPDVQDLIENIALNQVAVELCVVGRYIDGATGVCTPCPAGTYSTTHFATTAAACVKCRPGTFSGAVGASNASTCQDCPGGTFSITEGATDSSVCQACGAGATSVPGAQGNASCRCLDGYYGVPVAGGCTPCEEGYYCSLGVRNPCPGFEDSVSRSVSPPMSTAPSACYCRPGFYQYAYQFDGCVECPQRAYCDGSQSSGPGGANYGNVYECPANSVSNVRSTKLDDCVCEAGHRSQYSSPADRQWSVSATPCSCSVGAASCAAVDVANCKTCPSDTSCSTVTHGTHTCKQGYIALVEEVLASAASVVTRQWIIAPPGAERVRVTLTRVVTGAVSNTISLSECTDAACTSSRTLASLSQSPATPQTYTSNVNYPVVRVTFTAANRVTNPFTLQYGTDIACDKASIASAPVMVQFRDRALPDLNPYVPDTAWPIVLWLGDSLEVLPGMLTLDIRNATGSAGVSVLSPVWGLQKWTPAALGSYFLVDLAFSSRSRSIQVVGIDPRRVAVWYDVSSGKFVLSGDVAGSGSPDILLIQRDVLSMSRLSSVHGMVLLSAYTNASVFTLLGGFGVAGQSAIGRLEPSVTWDTAGYSPGVYYYASGSSMSTVTVGKIILHPLGGGLTCALCRQGEFCQGGQVSLCPANSRSSSGSDDASDCVCVPGFAQSTVDLETYSNGQTVDSGGRHTCVVDNAGGLWCWGANAKGQLGLGTVSATPTTTPQLVPGASDVRNISLGDDFTCVVHGPSLQVKCWGDNEYGQLGLDSNAATQASPGADAKLGTGSTPYTTKSLACAGQVCCAIISKTEAGNLVDVLTCWGRGNNGQLGHGGGDNLKNIGTGKTSFSSSQSRFSFEDTGFALTVGVSVLQQVSMAADHGCAVGQIGEVVCWGYNLHGEVGVGLSGVGNYFQTPTQIQVGGPAKVVNCFSFVCCAVMKGTYQVKCWGRASGGRLGVGKFDVGTTAQSMGANLQPVDLGVGVMAMDVNVGATQTCVLLSNHHVKCWGQIGGNVVGDEPPVDMMEMLPSLALVDNRLALQINGKGSVTCAVTSDYRAVCWAPNTITFPPTQLGGVEVSAPDLGGVGIALVDFNGTAARTSGQMLQASCVACERNTYCPGQAGPPLNCPANSASAMQSTTLESCVCLPGYKKTSGGTTCQLCTGKEYCALGTAYTCPARSSTRAAGSSDVSACECEAGYYYGGPGVGCTACGMGEYKEELGNRGNCTKCPVGTRNGALGLATVAGCQICGPGLAAPAGSAACTECGEGTYAGANFSACLQCRAGFFAAARAGSCTPCAAGTYDSDPRDGRPDTCSPCVGGKYSAAQNATEETTCLLCPAGSSSGSGASVCVPCAAGRYSEEGESACEACPGNSTSLGGTSIGGCFCLAGFKKRMLPDGRLFVCDQCGTGEYAAANTSGECERCPAGTASSARGASLASTCSDCGAGRFSAAGASVCTDCAASTFAAGARTGNCTPCDAGFYSAARASQCIGCPLGTYSLGPVTAIGQCLPCPAGTFCVGGEAAKAGSLPLVQPCPLGTFRNSTGARAAGQCLACPANFFCPSPTTQGACPTGTRSNASSTSQLQCTCVTGYLCNYNRIVNAVIRLMMSKLEFESEDVQTAFKAAVAKAAKTTADRVVIKNVLQVESGGRRLLSTRGVHVLLEIQGGEGRSLESGVRGALSEMGLRAAEGKHVVWMEPHEVLVRRA